MTVSCIVCDYHWMCFCSGHWCTVTMSTVPMLRTAQVHQDPGSHGHEPWGAPWETHEWTAQTQVLWEEQRPLSVSSGEYCSIYIDFSLEKVLSVCLHLTEGFLTVRCNIHFLLTSSIVSFNMCNGVKFLQLFLYLSLQSNDLKKFTDCQCISALRSEFLYCP